MFLSWNELPSKTRSAVSEMKRSLTRRLESLEEDFGGHLDAWGVQQQSHESRRDAFARGLGMTTGELRAQLAEMRTSPSVYRGSA